MVSKVLCPESRFLPALLPAQQAAELLQYLLNWQHWRQERVVLFGRSHLQPRLSAFVGDAGLLYCYSGLKLQTLPWPSALMPILEAVCQQTGCRFNSCLLNFYRNGRDHMGWHADNEPELGPEPALAIYSLGVTRRLHLRRGKRGAASLHYDLNHNSLLFMPTGMQQHWQHRLAPSKRVQQPRISLTFRKIVPNTHS